MAYALFAAGNEAAAMDFALQQLAERKPRGSYELGMIMFHKGDFIKAVAWNELCLQEFPDWTYSFLAMHSIAASYHKAGVLSMADTWARLALDHAPFFEPSRTFLLTR